MKTLGNVIVYVGLFLVFIASIGNPQGGISWPGLALGAVVVLVGSGMTLAGLQQRQAREDGRAKRILESGDLEGHALYLRPFETDGKFIVNRETGNLFDWDQYDRAGTDSLERMMANAFASTCLLIGAGGRGGADFGAATSGFLEDWKPVVSKAITSASWIVLVPSAQPGTQWEIGQILRHGALRKTVFLMPPSAPPLSYLGSIPLSKLWSSADEACSIEHGIKLPRYDKYGALFRLDEATRSVSHEAPFDTRSPSHLSDAINRVL